MSFQSSIFNIPQKYPFFQKCGYGEGVALGVWGNSDMYSWGKMIKKHFGVHYFQKLISINLLIKMKLRSS
jgi:hypothetical protein